MAFGEDLDKLVEDTGGLLGKHQKWERVRLGEVTEVINGFAFKSKYFSKDEGEPLVRIRDILSGETGTLYNGPQVDGYDIELGDLLIGMDGDFNSARWKGRKALLNQRVCRVDFKTDLYHPRLLSYALPGYLNKINAHTSAVTVKHLSSRTVKNIPLPLPPLAEQERIVDKIDELFSEIEAGERAIGQARAGVTRYRKAILKAAVTGELTADWRIGNPTKESAKDLLARILTARYEAWEKSELTKLDAKGKPRPETEKQWEKFRARYKAPAEPDTKGLPDLPRGWLWTKLEQLCDRITDGTHQAPKKSETGIPFVVIGNVSEGQINWDDVKKFVSPAEFAIHTKHIKPRAGDVLYTAVGSYGMAVHVKDDRDFLIQRHIAHLRPSKIMNSDFVEQLMNSPLMKSQADRKARGVAQKTVTLGCLSSFDAALPPTAEQAEIVNRVEQALSKADAVEATLDAQSRAAKALKQAVLKTAFEGKLVAQNPNDEPASELLKRIKEET